MTHSTPAGAYSARRRLSSFAIFATLLASLFTFPAPTLGHHVNASDFFIFSKAVYGKALEAEGGAIGCDGTGNQDLTASVSGSDNEIFGRIHSNADWNGGGQNNLFYSAVTYGTHDEDCSSVPGDNDYSPPPPNNGAPTEVDAAPAGVGTGGWPGTLGNSLNPDALTFTTSPAACDVGDLTLSSDYTVNPVTDNNKVICRGTGKVQLNIQDATMKVTIISHGLIEISGQDATLSPADGGHGILAWTDQDSDTQEFSAKVAGSDFHIGPSIIFTPRSGQDISGSDGSELCIQHIGQGQIKVQGSDNQFGPGACGPVEALPTITVDKTASPLSLPQPGGTFTFTVVVTNTSAEAVTISSLSDDIYGTLAGDADCQIGTVLAASGGNCSFSFTGSFTGDAGASQTDVVTACADDGEANLACDTDDATVTITDVTPTITVDKTASPLSLPEPGGTFTFTVVVSNSSVEAVTITSLSDDIYGTLAGDADCQVGTVLAANTGSCTFSFTGSFTGNAGASQTDVVTACADDGEQNVDCDDDDATVTITDALPTITVDKTASPLSLPEPGGTFTFTVVVSNSSPESVTLASLSDDIYGTLVGDADCQVGTVLAANTGSCTFSFTGSFTGNAGASQTDVVTACADDNEQNRDCDDDDATVTITDVLPTITVVKTASPLSLPEPGGTFTFTVVVSNSSVEAVTIASLSDDIYGTLSGDADCQIGTVLAANTGSCTFSFTGSFTGDAGASQTDIVTACADDNEQNRDCDDDDATVTITDVEPTITVVKTASPLSLPEPGGTFTFTVVVTNSSPEAVTIASLTDDIYGTLSGDADCAVGTVLAANTGSCTFSFTGSFTGDAGDDQTDVVTVCADDNEENRDCDDDDAEVEITDVEPTITVDKTASPISLPEPGGDFTFTVVVTNTSIESVTIASLSDDIYGTLVGDADCQVGTVLIANTGSCTFSFVGEFLGDPGDDQTDVVTVCADDNEENRDCDDDDATVLISDISSPIVVTKDANPTTMPAPGGNVTFSVTIENTSDVDVVTITSLTDDKFGNLDGRGTCDVPVVLDPHEVYACTFIGAVSGSGGTSHVNIVTASGTDDDDHPVSDSDDATVRLTLVPALVHNKVASTETIIISGPNNALVATPSVVTWTLSYTLTNGPVTGAVITDPVPTGFVFLDAANGGTFASGTVTWNLGNLNSSGSVSFRTTVDPATISRTAPTVNTSVIDSNETPPDDGTDSVTVTVQPPPLGGNPTPAPVVPNTAMGTGIGGEPITVPVELLVAFFLGSLGALAFANVRSSRRR